MNKRRLRRHVEKKTVFTVECTVASACSGDHVFDGPTLKDVVEEMVKDGWLDDFIVEDTINLACGSCVRDCKDSIDDFEQLDFRAGGKARA